MAQLNRSRSAFLVNRCGNPLEHWKDLFPHPHLMPKSEPVARNGTIRHGGHPDPAGSYVPVMFQEQLGRALVLTHSLETARTNDSISQIEAGNPSL